ncbi:hypothetical protein DAI22_02g374000 [Oryza sativa Japonica Group]|nr:uncharacterized protein LOC4331063 isoform X1 [Oryza sativa Japonica Group]KAF2947517.1 hypothetical protein DAI22_02g374000 [Oryza sativa Japonica Group]
MPKVIHCVGSVAFGYPRSAEDRIPEMFIRLICIPQYFLCMYSRSEGNQSCNFILRLALRAKKSATKLKRSAEMGSMYRHLRDRSSRRRRFSPAWRQELARQESPGVAGGRRQGRWCRSWHGRRIGRDDQEIGLLPANRGGRRNPPGGDPGAERRRRRVPIHGHGRAGEVPLQLACLTDETQVFVRARTTNQLTPLELGCSAMAPRMRGACRPAGLTGFHCWCLPGSRASLQRSWRR